jgi:hypothetical protein
MTRRSTNSAEKILRRQISFSMFPDSENVSLGCSAGKFLMLSTDFAMALAPPQNLKRNRLLLAATGCKAQDEPAARPTFQAIVIICEPRLRLREPQLLFSTALLSWLQPSANLRNIIS